jgi:hypothetical protein
MKNKQVFRNVPQDLVEQACLTAYIKSIFTIQAPESKKTLFKIASNFATFYWYG